LKAVICREDHPVGYVMNGHKYLGPGANVAVTYPDGRTVPIDGRLLRTNFPEIHEAYRQSRLVCTDPDYLATPVVCRLCPAAQEEYHSRSAFEEHLNSLPHKEREGWIRREIHERNLLRQLRRQQMQKQRRTGTSS
jgi:hypothetical protein